jgi:hypothetical protein
LKEEATNKLKKEKLTRRQRGKRIFEQQEEGKKGYKKK